MNYEKSMGWLNAVLALIGIFFIVTAFFVCLPNEEKILETQIVSTSHTVTGGYADVKVIESEEPKCYYIEDGFKIYENGERIPLF